MECGAISAKDYIVYSKVKRAYVISVLELTKTVHRPYPLLRRSRTFRWFRCEGKLVPSHVQVSWYPRDLYILNIGRFFSVNWDTNGWGRSPLGCTPTLIALDLSECRSQLHSSPSQIVAVEKELHPLRHLRASQRERPRPCSSTI